jgi:hypothetical protein
MNDKFDDDDFEVIPSDAIERSARGRKASPEAEKVAAVLATLKPGQTVVIKSMKVDLNGKDAVKARSRVSAVIRSGARIAGVTVKIAFRPSDGAPQVTVVK